MHETSCPGGSSSETTAAMARPGHDSVAARAPGSAEADRRQIEDHDRIAAEINDVVVRRLYSAGLALQSALGLLDGHRAGERIQDATAELDQAIIDLRNIVFGTRRPDRPHGAPG